jgi:hypothetical protein
MKKFYICYGKANDKKEKYIEAESQGEALKIFFNRKDDRLRLFKIELAQENYQKDGLELFNPETA